MYSEISITDYRLIIMEKFQEDAKSFGDIIHQFTKMYIEASKLHFQKALPITDDPYVFMSSGVFQDYLCTYIHSYEGSEVQFDEFNKIVNPDVFKNGVLVMSKRPERFRNMKLDSESSDHDGSGPLNSTPNGTILEDFNFDDCSVTVNHFCVVSCGSCELRDKDVNMGGLAAFHDTLGKFQKTRVDLTQVGRVSSMNGRHLSSLYIHSLKHIDIENAPTFVVCCEPKSPMNIASLIVFPELSEGRTLLHIVSAFSDKEKQNLTVKEDTLLSTSYFSSYDVVGQDGGDKTCDETFLKIDFHWSSSMGETSNQSPPRSAKPIIKLHVALGEDRSPANDVYLELKRLQMNKSIMADSMSSCSDQVREDLRNFKKCVEDIQFYNQDTGASAATEDLETPMSQLLIDSFWNKDIDFTDKLWKFIQEPGHMNDIRFILQDLLADIVSGTLQPALSPNNETRLARYIRRMYVTSDSETLKDIKEKIMDLTSSEQALVNLVQEIGYEKLRKDYFHFFVSRELTSLSNLEQICKPSKVNLDSLWKLHYCLELVITPTIYLNMTPDFQSILLNAAIDYYINKEVEEVGPIFNLLVLPFHELSSSLHAVCKDRKPVCWQHGFLHTNRAGLSEAIVQRSAAKTILTNSTSAEGLEIIEEESVFKEETLPLPRVNKH